MSSLIPMAMVNTAVSLPEELVERLNEARVAMEAKTFVKMSLSAFLRLTAEKYLELDHQDKRKAKRAK
jgi:hypothetical protein